MTTYTWKNGTSGNWNTSADWSGGAIPNGTTADVTISIGGSYTVTLPSATSYTVDSVVLNNSTASFIDSGTLTLGGSLASFTFDGDQFILGSAGLVSGALLDIDYGEFLDMGGKLLTQQFILGTAGTLALNGKSLTLAGTSTLDGNIYGTGTLDITGAATIGSPIYLESKATLAVAGTLSEVGPYDELYLGNGAADASVLDILSTGTYTIGVSSAYTGYNAAINGGGAGTVVNAGLLINSDPNGSGTADYISAVIDNTGTIQSNAGTPLELEGGGSIAGTLAGAGEVDFYAGSFALAASLAASVATLGFEAGGTVQLGGNITLANTANFLGGTVALAGHTLTLAGNDDLNGVILGTGGSTASQIVLTGTAGGAGLDFENNATLVDAGTFILSANGGFDLEFGNFSGLTDSSALTIKAGGVLDMAGTPQNTIYGDAITEFDGSGTIANAGLLEATGFAGALVEPYLNNTGTLLATAGDDLKLQGGGYLGGTLTGAGEIELTAGTFTLAASLGSNLSLVADTGVVLLLPANEKLANLDLAGGNLGLGTGATTITGNSELNGTIYGNGTAASTVVVTGTALITNQVALGNGVVLIDEGTIYNPLAGTGALELGTGGSVVSVLSITSAGTFALYGAAPTNQNITENENGSVVNAGLIYSNFSNGDYGDNPDFFDYISAPLFSTGTIDSAAGRLVLQDGGSLSGVLTGAGEIDFDTGNYTLSPGISISVATLGFDVGNVTVESNLNFSSDFVSFGPPYGDYEGNSGTLLLNGHHVTFGNALFDSSYYAYTYGEISGPGTLSITGAATLDNLGVTGGAVIVDSGTILTAPDVDVAPTLYLGLGAAPDSATLSITSSGTLALGGTYYGAQIVEEGNGTVINAGLIDAGYTPSYPNDFYSLPLIDATLYSTGTIDAAAGGIELEGGGSIGGELIGPSQINFVSGNYTLSPTLQISVGTLGFNGSVVTLGGNLNLSASDVTVAGGTIALNGDNLTLASAALSGAGAVYGPGTLTLTGLSTNTGFNIDGGAEIELAGTLVQNAPNGFNTGFFISNGGADTGYLKIDAGGVYDLQGTAQNGSNINDNGGGGTVINAGLIDSQYAGLNGTANAFIVTVDSTGTLESDFGAFQLYAGGTLGGTLNGAGEIDLNGGVFNLAPGISITVAHLGIGGEVIAGGNLAYAGAFNLESGGVLYLNGDAVTLSGTAALNGNVEASGDLKITGQAVAGGLYVSGGAVLEDASTITQTGYLQLGNGDSGTLAIDAGAVYNLQNQAGNAQDINESGNGTILNAGLLELTGYNNGIGAQIYAGLQNTGTITDFGAGVLNFDNGIDNDGLITLGSTDYPIGAAALEIYAPLTADTGKTGTIALGANAVLYAGGTVTGQKILFTTAGTLGSVLQIGDLAAFSGTVAGFAGGDVIDLQDVLANGETYANGILTLTETTTGSPLALVGTLALSSVTGTIALDSDGAGGTEILLNETVATYSNPKTAPTTSTWFGSAGNWFTAADWSPAGQPGSNAIAQITGGNSFTIAYSETDTVYQLQDSDSNAKLYVEGGKLTVEDGGYAYGTLQVNGANFDALTGFDFYGLVSFASNGTLEADTGTMYFDGGAVLAGTITGDGRLDGSLDFAEGNVALNAGFNVQAGAASLDFLGAGVTLGANQTLAAPVEISGSSFDFAGHTLVLAGASALANPFDDTGFTGPGTLSITGTAALGAAALNGGANLAVSGLLLENNELYVGNGNTDPSSILIAAGGTYALADDGGAFGISENGVGSLKNTGLLELTGYGNDTDQIALPIINTGTILAAEGDLQFSGGGTLGGKLTGAGEIDLLVGTFAVTAGLAISPGTFGLLEDASLNLGGMALTLSGFAELGNNTGYFENINGAGTLKITGTANADELFLEGNKTTLEVAGTLNQIGASALGLDYRSPSTDTSVILIDHGGTYDMVGSGEQILWGGGSQSVVNNGMLETSGIFATGQVDQILAPFINTGTVLVNTGDLQFTDGGTLSGTLAGSGEIDLTDGSFLLNSLSLGIAVLNASGANLTLGSNLTYSGALIDTSGIINLNAHTLTLSDLASGLTETVEGPGTLKVLGTANVPAAGYDPLLTGGAVLEDAGTFNATSGYVFYIGNSATDSATLLIDPGATFNMASGEIYTQGSASIANNGTFDFSGGVLYAYNTGGFQNNGLFAANAGAGNVLSVQMPVNNTGTILATTGVLELGYGGSLGGTYGGGAGTVALINGYGIAAGATQSAAFASGGQFGLANSQSQMSLSGPGTFASSGTLTIADLGYAGVSGNWALNLGTGLTWHNSGTVNDLGEVILGQNYGDTVTLSNAGTWDLASTDASLIQYGGPNPQPYDFTNAGLLENSGATGLSGVALVNAVEATLTNTGTILATTGALELPYLINAGSVIAQTGALIVIGGESPGNALGAGLGNFSGSVLGGTYSGAIALVGSFNLTGHDESATFGAGVQFGFNTPATQAYLTGAGTFASAGTLAIADLGTPESSSFPGLNLGYGAVWDNSGTVTEYGALILGQTYNDAGSISNSGTWNLADDDASLTQYGGGPNAGIFTFTNSGLLERTGGPGLFGATQPDVFQATLANTGTVLVAGGELDVDFVANNVNGTLTGGTWESTNGLLELAGAISTDAANIILSSASASIETVNAPTPIEASLQNIAGGGTLQILGGRGFAAENPLSDSGTLILGGGVLSDAVSVSNGVEYGLSINTGGLIEGFGEIAFVAQNNGEILANAPGQALDVVFSTFLSATGTGTLGVAANSSLELGGIIGTGQTIAFGGAHALLAEEPGVILSGTIASLAPGDTIDIATTTVSAATLSGDNLFITLSGGTVLDQALSAPISGERLAITSDGSTGSDLILYREAAAATITPSPLAFGNHHIGATVSTGLTIANTQPADGYSEALDASFASHLGGITTAGTLTTLAAGATNGSALSIGLLTATAGTVAGDAVITLASDGAGTDGNLALSLGSQTIAVSGAVFAYAAPGFGARTITLGQAHTGAADTAEVTLYNIAANPAFTEALDASFTGTSGAVLASGTVSQLAAGTSNSSNLIATLATGTAGSLSGTATLGLVSDGTVIDGLGLTTLAAQTLLVTGTVFNYATAAGLPGTISFGEHHAGAIATDSLTLTNAAASGIYSEGLDASFSGTTLTTGSFSTSGTITTLAAGASNTTLTLKAATGTAGSIAGSAFITLTSDGAGIDTLGKTGLGIDTVAVTGAIYNYATATPSVTTLSLGDRHVGTGIGTLTLKNSAAPGAYSENLDAKFTGTSLTSGSFTTGGTISLLAAGSSSSALTVTLAGAAGLVSGHATLGLTSDATGIDTLSATALTSETIAVTGTLFNEATASLSPATLALGQYHVGALGLGTIAVANTAPAGIYSEGLDASFSGTSLTAGSFSTAGGITTLGAGGTSALTVSLATGAAGTISGTATIALKSDGTGIDTLGLTALTSKVETITGAVFAYAAATLANTIINFGIIHTGTSAAQDLILSNGPASAYTESLDAAFTGTSAGFAAAGSVTHLAAGATNSTSLALSLASTATTGILSGTATLALTSDGSGVDTLGTTALGTQIVTLTGTIDNYATAALEQLAGAGTLSGGGTSYQLNLGNIQQGMGSLTASLGVLNSATGLSDLLGGGFTISNASGAFTDTGFTTFASLAAGQADTAPAITLSGTNAGAFSELITLSSTGSNASGYHGILASITLDVTGNVLHTYTLTTGVDTIAGAGNDLIIAKSGQLSAGDIINAGTGTNILTLSGGGTFDMRAPATLTGISIVDAQENIGTAAQTLYLDAGFSGTVNAASGTAGASFVVIGNLDSATINLGNGNDTIYVGSSLETINSGGGNDIFFVSNADAGATLNGGSGQNTLEVSGGGSFALGGNITSISNVVINELSTQSETFTANGIAGLAIQGGAGNDTITLGAASQSVVTGSGNTTIYATAAQAGAAITNQGNATLILTTGGNATLNANDDFLTVSLTSATNLTLSNLSFITEISGAGNDTITAMATEQTLTGGAGVDTLIGYAGFSDMFLGSANQLNGDTIQYFGGNDLIDLTNLARAGASLSYIGSATNGTLSVTNSGLTANISLSSGTNLAQSLFHMTSDGHGGTYIALI